MSKLGATEISEAAASCFFFCLPAGCSRETAQADLPLAARAFEETLDGIMPVVIMFLFYTTLSWFEVCVLTLQDRKPHFTLLYLI